MFVPFLRHWNVLPVPSDPTLNVTGSPGQMILPVGWLVILTGIFTVKLAAPDVTLWLNESVTMQRNLNPSFNAVVLGIV